MPEIYGVVAKSAEGRGKQASNGSRILSLKEKIGKKSGKIKEIGLKAWE